ncbi:hypothetical protein EZV62_008597 [Acer yangbiense]|uniref:Uncharacterized protein n=1 Tax=Acer yangbiense TaxID=1000413 RepID=A0A5C7IEF5_9ROSI|nr:hypothetical protein EZV62_008597 [Acer yangbiense]
MEPDEITRLCESFARISKEEKLWSVKENLKEAAGKKLDLCLVGKILSTKHVNREAFRAVILRIWQTRLDIEEMSEFLGRLMDDLVDIDVGAIGMFRGGKYEGLGLSAGSIVIEGGDKVDEIGEKRDTEREKVNIPLRFEKVVGPCSAGVCIKESHGMHGVLCGDNGTCMQKAILEVESKAEAGRVGGVGYNVGMNEGVIKGEKKGKWKRLAREKGNQNASLDVETQEPKKRGVEISSLEG